METLIKSIDKQIEFNHGKNMFSDKPGIFQFTNETINAIPNIHRLNSASKALLINYASNKAIEEFYRINQYYSFNLDATKHLKKIYSELLYNFQAKTYSIENISKQHYKKLKNWLKKHNPFAERIYKNSNEKVNIVTCAEYTPQLQINMLQININNLMQPILDIGCGSNAYLVNYLKKQGNDVYGIDRHRFSDSNLSTTDWLEYDYGKAKWGTIVSHLSFSNHFNHHNLRADGNYIEYGKTYMKILHSLKLGGHFYYAPDLPFIEKYIDRSMFDIKKNKITRFGLKTTTLKKLN